MSTDAPQARAVGTWNADENRWMIAINDALGCRVAELGVAMQRSL